MTIMCGIRCDDRGDIIDVHFGRVPTVGETVLIFKKLYKVTGVTWSVVANNRYKTPGGPIVETVYSATQPIIDVALVQE